MKGWPPLDFDLRIAQPGLHRLPVRELYLRVLLDHLFEQPLSVGCDARGGIIRAYLASEWEFQVFLEVPGKLVFLFARRWIADSDVILRPVVDAHDGLPVACFIRLLAALLYADELWHIRLLSTSVRLPRSPQ